MNWLQAILALSCAMVAALPIAANTTATDKCGDIDVDQGPALRVIKRFV